MKKVLIVDDEPNIVMSLEYILKKNNYEVFIARNGKEAIESISQNHPDLVLLDLMMPEIDGYETIEWIKNQEEFQDLVIIVISAKNKANDIEKALHLGANLFVPKPFSVKKLVDEINQFN